MDELTGILIAVVAMFAGLWVLGWAYGDFRRSKQPSGPESAPPTTPPPPTTPHA